MYSFRYKRWFESFELISRQERTEISGIRMDAEDRFYYQDHTRRRVGYMFGRVQRGWVDVYGVYEPPQRGLRNRFLLLSSSESEVKRLFYHTHIQC